MNSHGIKMGNRAIPCFHKKAQKENRIYMEPKDYTVIKIEGEYAYLREDGGRMWYAEKDITSFVYLNRAKYVTWI